MGLFRSRSRRRTKVRRNKVEVVRFRIERHGLGAILCLDRLENGELVRRFFVEDMNHVVPGGHEQQTRRGVISVGVYTAADWERLHNFSAVCIHSYEELGVAARDEQPPM